MKQIIQIKDAIEVQETRLNMIQMEANKHREKSDMGWWLTLAGESAGAAVAISEGEEARRLEDLARKLEKKIMLLEVDKRVLQAKVDSGIAD